MKKLPKSFPLPGGRKIQVILVDDLKMAELIGQDYNAVWFDKEGVIYVRKNLPLPSQWYYLTHEMQHVIADWQNDLLLSGVAKP